MWKKQRKIGIITAAAVLMITGCAGGSKTADVNKNETQAVAGESTEEKDSKETADTQEAANTPETADTKKTTDGISQSETDLDPAYQAIVQDYQNMITENWDWEKIYEKNYSSTIRNMGGTIDQVGYTLYDLDLDGQKELLIGETDTDLPNNRIIFDAYTLENGQAKQIFVSQERSLYYLIEDEAGAVLIANEGSNGAASHGWIYYTVEHGTLSVQQAILYDAMADEQNPWFMAYDDSWDTTKAEPIDEETGQGIVDGYANTYAKLDWIPLGK